MAHAPKRAQEGFSSIWKHRATGVHPRPGEAPEVISVGVAHMQRHFEPPSLAISLRPPRYLRSCNISNAIPKVRPTKGVVRSTERGTIKINDLLNAKKDFGRKKCDCSELFGINLTKYRNMARQYFHLGTAFLNHLGTDC